MANLTQGMAAMRAGAGKNRLKQRERVMEAFSRAIIVSAGIVTNVLSPNIAIASGELISFNCTPKRLYKTVDLQERYNGPCNGCSESIYLHIVPEDAISKTRNGGVFAKWRRGNDQEFMLEVSKNGSFTLLASRVGNWGHDWGFGLYGTCP